MYCIFFCIFLAWFLHKLHFVHIFCLVFAFWAFILPIFCMISAYIWHIFSHTGPYDLHIVHISCIFFAYFLLAGLQAELVWCYNWWPYIALWVFSVFAIKESSKGLHCLSGNHDTISLPLLSLSEPALAFCLCLDHIHPSHRIPLLCFHLLVFMDIQAALCSGAVLSVNIHKKTHA